MASAVSAVNFTNLCLLPFPVASASRWARSMSSPVSPASSARRAPVSRNMQMMAVSVLVRRVAVAVPAEQADDVPFDDLPGHVRKPLYRGFGGQFPDRVTVRSDRFGDLFWACRCRV